MTFDLTTIGEGQIRLTAARGERLSQARSLRMTAAGSEANVAGVLSQLGRCTSWASRLPRGPLTTRVIEELRSVNVDLSNVRFTDSGRLALYFMEPGEYPMPGLVTYDREHTPFRDIDISHLDFASLWDTRLAYVTGISAALTENTARVLRYFVDGAAERGIEVVLDVNFRSLLWSGEQAAHVLTPLARKASILFCSRADAADVFGIETDGPTACARLRAELGAAQVITTDHLNGIYLCDEAGELSEFSVTPVPVIDRPGAGDAFIGATLHGYLDHDLRRGIEYGRRAAALALTHHGDLTRITPAEITGDLGPDIIR